MSKIQEIQEKIDKINNDIDKRMEKISKLEQKELVLQNKLRKTGVEFSDYNKFIRSSYAKKPNSKGHYKYDEYVDIGDQIGLSNIDDSNIFNAYLDLINNIRDQLSCWNKIFDLEDKLTNLETKLQMELAKQSEIDDIPPIFKELKMEVANDLYNRYKRVYEAVMNLKNEIRNNPLERKNLLNSFAEIYGSGAYDRFERTTLTKLKEDADKDADAYVLDLIRRVTKKIGNIIDYSDIYVNGPAINGTIIGDKGKTYVETIIAGGWNIQREHYRVILR
jgi:predicted  nucleic acid-binding Zn-ribbon protein